MHSIFNNSMDAGLIIVFVFIFALGLGIFLYCGEECCRSNEEEENRSARDSESTVRVTSPIH
jgi:hypothetical protein